MNFYIRYFDKETLTYSVDEALDFLRAVTDTDLDADMEADIREYAAGDAYFPKRYKVHPRVYFIIIKTTAMTLLDFKEKKALRSNPSSAPTIEPSVMQKDFNLVHLAENKPGWYEGSLDFRRVVMIVATGKHEYRDTHFVVRCKANSGQDCYNRIIEHLKERVDSRSQFPSARGKNFHFKYLGLWK